MILSKVPLVLCAEFFRWWMRRLRQAHQRVTERFYWSELMDSPSSPSESLPTYESDDDNFEYGAVSICHHSLTKCLTLSPLGKGSNAGKDRWLTHRVNVMLKYQAITIRVKKLVGNDY